MNKIRFSIDQPKPISLTIEKVRVLKDHYENMFIDTTENWNKQITYIPPLGCLIVYTDRDTVYDEMGNPKYIPGVKIGDGNAYVTDIPFIDDALLLKLMDHIEDDERHITKGERDFWNNKLNYMINEENLVFNRE